MREYISLKETASNLELLEQFSKYTKAPAWAVEYTNQRGQRMRTSWTSIRNEAIAWGRNLRDFGFTSEGHPTPV